MDTCEVVHTAIFTVVNLVMVIAWVDAVVREIPPIIIKFRILMGITNFAALARYITQNDDGSTILQAWMSIINTALGMPAMLYFLENFLHVLFSVRPDHKPERLLKCWSIFRVFLVCYGTSVGIAFTVNPINAVQIARYCGTLMVIAFCIMPVLVTLFRLGSFLHKHQAELRKASWAGEGPADPSEEEKNSKRRAEMARLKKTERTLFLYVLYVFVLCIIWVVGTFTAIIPLIRAPSDPWDHPRCVGAVNYIVILNAFMAILTVFLTRSPASKKRKWVQSSNPFSKTKRSKSPSDSNRSNDSDVNSVRSGRSPSDASDIMLTSTQARSTSDHALSIKDVGYDRERVASVASSADDRPLEGSTIKDVDDSAESSEVASGESSTVDLEKPGHKTDVPEV